MLQNDTGKEEKLLGLIAGLSELILAVLVIVGVANPLALAWMVVVWFVILMLAAIAS